jgi:hypothetical protein
LTLRKLAGNGGGVIDALALALVLSGVLTLHLNPHNNVAGAVGTVAIFIGGNRFQTTKYRGRPHEDVNGDAPATGTRKRRLWLWIVSVMLVPSLGWSLYRTFEASSRGSVNGIWSLLPSLGVLLLCSIFWNKLRESYWN